MEEKDKNNEKAEKEEKGSNSCVMDLSIDEGGEEKETNDKNDGNTNTLNKSFDDKLNFSNKLTLKDNFENILDLDIDNYLNEEAKSRSKTFAVKNINNIK